MPDAIEALVPAEQIRGVNGSILHAAIPSERAELTELRKTMTEDEAVQVIAGMIAERLGTVAGDYKRKGSA